MSDPVGGREAEREAVLLELLPHIHWQGGRMRGIHNCDFMDCKIEPCPVLRAALDAARARPKPMPENAAKDNLPDPVGGREAEIEAAMQRVRDEGNLIGVSGAGHIRALIEWAEAMTAAAVRSSGSAAQNHEVPPKWDPAPYLRSPQDEDHEDWRARAEAAEILLMRAVEYPGASMPAGWKRRARQALNATLSADAGKPEEKGI